MGSATQQYCLRWNNHRSNLLAVFDELLRNEAFTDVTLACEGGSSVKCHKMVLAACSSYFQSLFTELPCRHPVVVLKDVKYSEMKAILEYMYRGEVNVAHDQLAALLKVAEALKVKGLVEETGPLPHANPSKDSSEQHQPPPPQPQPPPPQQQQQQQQQQHQHQHQLERHREEEPPIHSPPSISTSTANMSPLPHSSSNISPPHSSGMPGPPFEKNPYNLYGKSPVMDRGSGRVNMPLWAMPGLGLHHPSSVPPPHPAAAMLNSCYDTVGADMSPLKRKKLQSLLMSRDTPILRTVLGQGQQVQQGSQGQADSSQPMSLVCQPDSHVERNHSNGSAHDIEKNLKTEPSTEEARSPYYTDISFMDEESGEKNSKLMLSQSFPGDVRGVSSGIATYVPTQKPEWKRYKQYTRNDIMSAIDAVRNGMSALQAARKFGVPSRTLYDKVKKMGITTSRPFNKRGSNVSTGGSSYFPYSGSGGNGGAGNNSMSGVYSGGGGGGGMSEGEEPMVNPSPSGAIMEPLFLQHALDGMKREISEREAMAAMAAAAAAHATSSARSGNSSSSPGENGNGRSPSPSPSLIKYIRSHNSMTPSPAAANNELAPPSSATEGPEDDEDQVEDLSVSRKPEPMRVIMPPMNPAAAKKEDMHEEEIREHCTSDESRNTTMEMAGRD